MTGQLDGALFASDLASAFRFCSLWWWWCVCIAATLASASLVDRWNDSTRFWPAANFSTCIASSSAASTSLQRLPAQVALSEHGWLGSAVGNWLAKILLEEQLHIGTKFVNIEDVLNLLNDTTANPLRDGSVTFDLENWEYIPGFLLLLSIL